MLAIPVKNTIQFYETDKWTKKKTYENDTMDEVCFVDILKNHVCFF
jgi:hypothetical protein